jgi:thiosulfate/3-mercaptopyruvate sulfurtransferase
MDLLVTADWLAANIAREDVKVLDGTWVLPSDEPHLSSGYIPSAHVFDIDKIADLSSTMKHMLPSNEVFTKAISEMGIKPSDHVICYDRHGLFSSPRVWWTFMAFGHDKVSVLDGGLPAWIRDGHETSSDPAALNGARSTYQTNSSIIPAIHKSCIINTIDDDVQIVDARPRGRFLGTSPEPREGLRSGRIPGSFSLPFEALKTSEGHFKPLNELAEIVGHTGVDLGKPIITSCGSGITAAGLAFVFHRLGANDIRLYDGSWAEWGASEAPIEI